MKNALWNRNKCMRYPDCEKFPDVYLFGTLYSFCLPYLHGSHTREFFLSQLRLWHVPTVASVHATTFKHTSFDELFPH